MSTTGRPTIPFPKDFRLRYNQWKDGSLTAVRTMSLLKLSKTTFYRMVAEYESNMESYNKTMEEISEKEAIAEAEAARIAAERAVAEREAAKERFTVAVFNQLKAASVEKIERLAASNDLFLDDLNIKQVITALVDKAVAQKFPDIESTEEETPIDAPMTNEEPTTNEDAPIETEPTEDPIPEEPTENPDPDVTRVTEETTSTAGEEDNKPNSNEQSPLTDSVN